MELVEEMRAFAFRVGVQTASRSEYHGILCKLAYKLHTGQLQERYVRDFLKRYDYPNKEDPLLDLEL